MIERIEVKHFRKLVDYSTDFTKGLNIVTGENAVGKTTLISAIAFALYGTKGVAGKAENIPTWGESNTRVTLYVNGHKIERTLKNCTVYKGDEIVAAGNSVSSNYIENELIGVDLRGFKLLYWSEQGETSAILTLGATQLQRDIENFSGIAFIDKIIKEVSQDVRVASSTVERLEAKLELVDGSRSDVVDKIVRLSKESENLRQDKEGSSQQLSDVLRETKSLQDEQESLQDDLSKVTKLSAKLSRLTEKLADDQTSLDEATSHLNQLEKELETIKVLSDAELEQLKTSIDEATEVTNSINHALDTIDSLKADLDGIQGKIENDEALEKAVESKKSEYEATKGICNDLDNKVTELSSELRKLNKKIKDQVCGECGRPIVDEATLKSLESESVKKSSELEEVKSEYSAVEEKLRQGEKSYKLAEKEYRDNYGNWASRKKGLESNLTEKESKLAELLEKEVSQKELNELSDKYIIANSNVAVKNSKLKELNRWNSKQCSLEGEVAETKSKLSKVKSELDSLPKDVEESLTDNRNQLKKLNESSMRLSEEVRQFTESLTAIEAELSEAERVIELYTELDEQEHLKANLKEFADYLKTQRTSYLADVWNKVLNSASTFLNSVTEGKITSLIRNPQGEFMYMEEGTYCPVTVASGAQKGFIGVAVRLALTEVLSMQFSTTILDEPTDAMREENARNLAGGLLDKPQVIMITHKEADQVTASNIVNL